ncbi:class I SAM-dependent methyltransferase, partial [Campylobacter lari]|uniref:class I SAM-dependent methyltransferase n=1 Tax=Campylobacter lari TaxID=201 RepID=UPI00372BB1A3
MNLWNKKAKSYARYSSNLNEIQKATFAKLGSLQGKSVVDIGCGSGVWTLHLAQKAKDVLVVDSSSAMLEILQDDAKT